MIITAAGETHSLDFDMSIITYAETMPASGEGEARVEGQAYQQCLYFLCPQIHTV